MRFQITRTLDAIEERLATDSLHAGAVLGLAEVIGQTELDGGRPASLIRLGMAIDALGRHLGDDTVAVYPVAERGLLSDNALTSNERMVIRRWSDDGLVEVLPAGTSAAARAQEIAVLTGLPLITGARVAGFGGTALALLAVPGGAALAPHPAAAGSPGPAPGTHPALGRWWRCPDPDCASFGRRAGERQPPPMLVSSAPTCPRHNERLSDAGPRPPAVPLVVCVAGPVRHRFAVAAGRPVVVGRLPDDAAGVALAQCLDEQSAQWISRSHIRLELRDGAVTVTDISTNGTTVVAGGHTVRLVPGRPHQLGEFDRIRLAEQVEIRRADRSTGQPAAATSGSVMSDAPTIAMRMPRT